MSAQPHHFAPAFLPLADLQVSETGAQAERRKRFDAKALEELAASLKSVGMLQPIVVRARGDEPGFQIIAGERRYLAAKLAGLGEVPVSVLTLTDEQVLEVQLIENLQREGLHELVEAEGYEALMKQHGYTVDDLVVKVGKSRAYVYARLKLLALGPAARQAFFDGDLNASVALLIARIPNPAEQRKATGEVVEGLYGAGPMSFRQAAEHIHRSYMLKLADAEFPVKDADLVASAGSCSACPKRTGNQPELFADVKSGDVCTDSKCFGAKVVAWRKQQVADARAKGVTVFDGADAKKMAPNDYTVTGFVKLDDQCWADDKHRTYRQLLGKKPDGLAVIQLPKSGKIVDIVPAAAARKVLVEKGVIAKRPAAAPSPDRSKERGKHDADVVFRKRVFAEMRAKFRDLDHGDLQEIAQDLIEHFYGAEDDGEADLTAAVQWALGPKATADEMQAIVAKGKCVPMELERLLFVLAWWARVEASLVKPTEMFARAKSLGVDVAKVKAAIAAEAKAAAKASAKTEASASKAKH